MVAPSVDPGTAEEEDEDVEDASESAGAEALPEELNAFLARRAKDQPRLALVRAFLEEILGWPDTTVRLGTSSTSADGKSNWVAISRGGWGGRFLLLFPKAMRIRVRLQEDEVADVPEAEFRKVRPSTPWRVRAKLTGPNGFDACLTMARRAYDKIGPPS